MNMSALAAFKGAQIVTGWTGHDASQAHASIALRAGWPFVGGQRWAV
jgi:hypothetical protein